MDSDKNDLLRFLENYLSPTDAIELSSVFSQKKSIYKKQLLISPGDNCSFIAYIREGAFRVYFYDDKGVEITIWFSFEGMVITDLLSYYQGSKAQFYVEALEDSELIIAQKSDIEKAYNKQISLKEFGRLFAEEALGILMERTLSLHTKTAQERYLELLKSPDYLNKIPLKHLASYLGVTDTSLSRIRRNLI